MMNWNILYSRIIERDFFELSLSMRIKIQKEQYHFYDCFLEFNSFENHEVE